MAPTSYADGIGVPVAGPNARRISNRVFNDVEQNLFSHRGISQWGTTWGQFLDHTFGLRAGGASEASIPFDNADPLERFHDDLPVIPFERSGAAPGTGVSTPREQPNLVSSYIEASTVYSDTADRLEWLREGPVDGNLANNGARLLLPGRYLPRRDTRGDPAAAPEMDDLTGELGDRLAVAGEFRGNENIALLATHTLLAREHNRIVSLLPGSRARRATPGRRRPHLQRGGQPAGHLSPHRGDPYRCHSAQASPVQLSRAVQVGCSPHDLERCDRRTHGR